MVEGEAVMGTLITLAIFLLIAWLSAKYLAPMILGR